MTRDLNVTPAVRLAPPIGGFVILASAKPRQPKFADLLERGTISAWLTHDSGVTWPDRRGMAVMDSILAEAGTVALFFATAEDAAACAERLSGASA